MQEPTNGNIILIKSLKTAAGEEEEFPVCAVGAIGYDTAVFDTIAKSNRESVNFNEGCFEKRVTGVAINFEKQKIVEHPLRASLHLLLSIQMRHPRH